MATQTYLYPENYQLNEVDQVMYKTLLLDDPIFEHFPAEPVDASRVEWEQEDDYLGLQAMRGMDGEAPRVNRVGAKRYSVEPGVYGEHITSSEYELTKRRQLGSPNAPMDVTDIVRRNQDQLRHRQVSRMRKILWDLSCYGAYQVQNVTEGTNYIDAYPIRTYVATVSWIGSGNWATAAPLYDLRQVQLMARGMGVTFGVGAKSYANQNTINNMLSNTNPADLYGRRMEGLSTPNTLEAANKIFVGAGLPEMIPHDDVYKDEDGLYHLFIPDGYVVIFGRRLRGKPQLGRLSITRNINTTPPNAPQPYTFVYEHPKPPKVIETHAGWNGAVELWQPGAIVVAKVA